MTCPQCRDAIDGSDVKSYAVGWCERDIHRGCLMLHVRACAPCRVHNEVAIYKYDEQLMQKQAVGS